MAAASLAKLIEQARACRVCAAHLPHGPRPVLHLSASARLLIVAQAPGARVHASGISFTDPSGDRLRDWLGVDRPTFYDETRVAILPMGFCYPGTLPNGGDAPPRPECAPLWQAKLRAALKQVELTLLVGLYAQAFYLGRARKASVTATVRSYAEYLPAYLPLPHPSWRTRNWQAKNPWFDAEVLPELRRRVAALLA